MNNRVFENKSLVIASHNQGKIREIRELLKPLKIKIFSAADLNLKEPNEDGNSFEDNALIKSTFVSKKTGLPSLSDDSGICFLDLDGKPGVLSARWAGEDKNFASAMLKIYNAIQKKENPSFKCFFICSLSLSWPDGYHSTVSGKVDGIFSWPPKGTNGFGYDPIFIPEGYKETFGEMEPKFKHSISHRAKAFSKLINLSFPKLKC